MPTCCSAPRSTSSMNGSPEIWAENRVQRAHSTQRSRSSRTCAEMLIGLGKGRLTPPLAANRDSPRPLDIAWFCKGHSPPLSQTGQSSGWLISRNSMMPCCALSATSLVAWLLTTMPSATGIVQEACGFGMGRPLPASGTSTRHWRQAPTGSSSGWSQNRGICTPTCSAARMISVPAGTLTRTPSIVSVTRSVFSTSAVLIWACLGRGFAGDTELRGVSSSGSLGGEDRGGDRVERAAPFGEVLEVLVAEVLDRAHDRAGGAVAERAERPAQDVVALVQQEVEILGAADALLQVGEGLDQPPGALPARRALAARLVLVELGPSQNRSDDAGRLVEDLQCAR